MAKVLPIIDVMGHGGQKRAVKCRRLYGHLRAFNPVATLLILLSECCVRLLAELQRTPRDHLFDGLATATGSVTTPRDHLFHGLATYLSTSPQRSSWE